jgi:Tol biopolymer transport system component
VHNWGPAAQRAFSQEGRRTSSLTRQCVILATALAFVAAGAAHGSPSRPDALPEFVFEQTRVGQSDLFRKPPQAGRKSRPVPGGVNTSANEIEPDWSPVAREVVYASDASDSWELYVIDLATSRKTMITDRGSNTDPVWSPDGEKIAFESNGAGNWDIWVYDTVTQETTNVSNNKRPEFDPAWSPGGERIVFTRVRRGASDLFTADLFTHKVRRLTQSKAFEFDPSWSPDGTQIAFDRLVNRDYDIYVLTLQPKKIVRLTKARGEDSNPDWSPDGSEILFLSARDGDYEVYKMKAVPNSPAEDVTANHATDEVGAHWIRGPSSNLFAADSTPGPMPGRRFCTAPVEVSGKKRIGGNTNDNLCGTPGKDVLLGRGGNDRLTGGDGRDQLYGGRGKDYFRARDGYRDALWGGTKAADDPEPDRGFLDKMLANKAKSGDARHGVKILSP